jgi:hypothetical protein
MNDNANNEDYYTDSIVQPGQHFRLRIGTQVVGYMNVRESRSVFYSKNNSSWTDAEIDHDAKDRSTEAFDANHRMIFEHDVVQLHRDSTMEYTKRGVVVWHHTYRTLVIKLIEEDGIVELDVPTPKTPFREDLTVISRLTRD